MLNNYKNFEQNTKECEVICICNQKGGVAKTSTCQNLSVSLAKMNKRVLLIDFDVQANLSMLFACRNGSSFFEFIDSGDSDISKYIVGIENNMWLLPSNSAMALAASKYLSVPGFECLLRDAIEPIKKVFDYILIDTPPSGDFFILNALMASDHVLIPTPCEYLSMNGVNHITNMIKVLSEKTDHVLDYRVLITFYDEENIAGQVIKKKLEEKHGKKILSTMINRENDVQESQIAQLSLLDYRNNSRAGNQYMELAKNVVAL